VSNISRSNCHKEDKLTETIEACNRQIISLQTDLDEKSRIISGTYREFV